MWPPSTSRRRRTSTGLRLPSIPWYVCATARIFNAGLCAAYPRFVKNGVEDDSTLLGGAHDVDQAVCGLNGVGIAVIERPFGDVAPVRPGMVAVEREGSGQGRARVHAVVVDEQQG